MDLSLLPKEVAEELGVEFESIDPATTGSTKTLPEKLRPTTVDLESTEEQGFLGDQTSGLISQLLAANWERAPDSLKRDIKNFLEGEISRSLAIMQSIDGGKLSEKEKGRLKTPDSKPITLRLAKKPGYPLAPRTSKGDTLWGDDKDLDQLIS